MEIDIVALLANYGFPIAISVILIYFLINTVNNKLDTLIQKVEKLIEDQREFQKEIIDMLKELLKK